MQIRESFFFGMSVFYTFSTALDEVGTPIGSEGSVPFLLTLPMIFFMSSLGEWLVTRVVNLHAMKQN